MSARRAQRAAAGRAPSRRARASQRLIVALDFTALAPALALARRLRGMVGTMKVGSVLFTACGPEAVLRVRSLGFGVMLDLKFFDIPNTVELSCRAATRLRVSLVTVHASGGRQMLEAAMRGVRDEAKRMRLAPSMRPRVLAITVLTSVPASAAGDSASAKRLAERTVSQQVVERATLALDAGCDGVVASAHEAAHLRRAFRGRRFSIICPGIRPALPAGRPPAAAHGDQQRVATPAQALAAGADALVVGRPITAAPDPRLAVQQILADMEGTDADTAASAG